MANRKSTFELMGLPQEFGVVLLTLALILLISPYLTNSDFGIFKVPKFPPGTLHSLRILGPVALAFAIALFIPFWKPSVLEGKRNETVIERSYEQYSEDVPASPLQLPGSVVSLAPDRLNPRTSLLYTNHSRIEEANVHGTRCIIKSTKKEFVDLDGLQKLLGQRINASFRETSVSIALPEKIWIEGDRVCELHPFFNGISLWDVIKRNRYRLRGEYPGAIFKCMVEALAKLHAQGILHRDVNPTNMLLTSTGDIVLLDVSFACRTDCQRIPVQNPAFSAPEQLAKRAVPQSDFYSLAGTAIFLANGREPAPITKADLLRQQIDNINFGPFYHRTPELDELIFQLLSVEVEQRPRSYRDILLDTGTWAVTTSLYGVFDLGRLGFMILEPDAILIGPRDPISAKLRGIDEESIEEPQLRADVKAFLNGKNPWLAT